MTSRDTDIQPQAAENLAALWEIPVSLMGGRVTRLDQFGVSLADAGAASSLKNNATLLRKPTPDSIAAVARSVTDYFSAGSGGPFSINSHWVDVDFSPYGYEQIETDALMYRPPASFAHIHAPSLEIRRVDDATLLAAFEHAFVHGFAFDALLPFQRGAVFDERVLADDRFRLWVGMHGDDPVASAAACAHGGVLGLYHIATVPGMRGRGYGTAMTSVALSSEPRLPSVLQASPAGHEFYLPSGYRQVGEFTFWRAVRSG